MPAPTFKIVRIKLDASIIDQAGYPLGRYNLHIHYFTKQTGTPPLSSPAGVAAGAGGSLVAAVQELPDPSVETGEYTDVKLSYNAPPTIAANLLRPDTTIDTLDPVSH